MDGILNLILVAIPWDMWGKNTLMWDLFKLYFNAIGINSRGVLEDLRISGVVHNFKRV